MVKSHLSLQRRVTGWGPRTEAAGRSDLRTTITTSSVVNYQFTVYYQLLLLLNDYKIITVTVVNSAVPLAAFRKAFLLSGEEAHTIEPGTPVHPTKGAQPGARRLFCITQTRHMGLAFVLPISWIAYGVTWSVHSFLGDSQAGPSRSSV